MHSLAVGVFCRYGEIFCARLSSSLLNQGHENQHSCFVVCFFLVFQILSFYNFFYVWRTSFSHSLRGSLNLFYKNQSRALAISSSVVGSSLPPGTAGLTSWRQCSNPWVSPNCRHFEVLDVRLSNSSQKSSLPLTLLPFLQLPSQKISCNSLNTYGGMEEREITAESQLRLPHCGRPGCQAQRQTAPLESPLKAGCCPKTSDPNLWSPQNSLIWQGFVDAVKDLEMERWPRIIWVGLTYKHTFPY